MPEFKVTSWKMGEDKGLDVRVTARNHKDAYWQAEHLIPPDQWYVSIWQKDELDRTMCSWTFEVNKGRKLRCFREKVYFDDGYEIIHQTRYYADASSEYDCMLVNGPTGFIKSRDPLDDLMKTFSSQPQEYVLTDVNLHGHFRNRRLVAWMMERISQPWNVRTDDPMAGYASNIWSFASSADVIEAKLLFA